MIRLPSTGIAKCVKVHRVDLMIFCDWIEASALFVEADVSGSDLVDILVKNNIYSEQSFAWEFVNDALSNLDVRSRLIGEGYPFSITSDTVSSKGTWQDYTPYAFCLMLSLAKSHSSWVRTFGANFTVQGELFEKLTAEAVSLTLPGWTVFPTGWSRTQTARIKQVVENICNQMNEAAGEIFRWTRDTAKEAGLDLITYRSFADGNAGVPIYLWQCASGMDWVGKRKTPDLALWGRLVQWPVIPKKAMAMPFALSEQDMALHSNIIEGLLLDRHRLLEPGLDNRDWVSAGLRTEIINWLTPRITGLPILELAAV